MTEDRWPRRGRRLVSAGLPGALGAALALGALVALGGAGTAPAGAQATSRPLYYVSLGDSYAAGYQPTSAKGGHTTTNGFAYQTARLAAAKGYHFTLVNFGCGGATSTSILTATSCPQLGPGAPDYPPTTQAAAAEQFIAAHKGRIGLITVSIGGNDVTACAASASPIPCVATAVNTIKTNLATLLGGLRTAAGPGVRIVGTTYPDVILGDDLSASPAEQNLAKLSVVAFKSLINPALAAQYHAVGGEFVDVTAATGAYGPLGATTTLAPYGRIPVPVAKVCELTYFCQYHNIHPHTAGYAVIAKLIVATLPRRS
jgi:lysophospholipase L1-like esterase